MDERGLRFTAAIHNALVEFIDIGSTAEECSSKYNVPLQDLLELYKIYSNAGKRIYGLNLPKYQVGYWVREKNNVIPFAHNKGIITEYCGYFAPDEWDEKFVNGVEYRSTRASMHRGLTGHVYRIERHLENWRQEYRDYYCSEDLIECDI